MLKRISFFSAFLLVTLACGAGTTQPTDLLTPEPTPTDVIFPTPTPEPTVPPTATEIPPTVEVSAPIPQEGYGPDNFPANVNPLTGLVVDDATILDRRPVSVKVNNYPRSNRPQWGLSLADIVYEYYHNNEIPRFHAIFYGQNASQVGPIRSARLFDDYLVDAYDSILNYGSADFRIRDRLAASGYGNRLVVLLEGSCPPTPVCRYEPAVLNYLVSDTAELTKWVTNLGVENGRQNLDGMAFQDQVPAASQGQVDRVYIRYSYAAYSFWEYDPGLRIYYRHQDTREDIGGAGEGYALLTDRLTGYHIAADNVVVLIIPHFYNHYQPPSNGTPAVEVVDMNFVGTGKAYAFRDGQSYELEWVRPTDGSTIYLQYPDGTRWPFKPGTTWFQVMSDLTLLEKVETVWRFQFAIR
ncbi:MAG: DUF3048 domain-containing protein [Chloroflexi bacterium]|nr:MAG: DUF3048 domain-containing protein [Chloroflexota bacterium]MBL1194584.1 DUF3048 domain-containing protein [Chloroflexota bacterium]NOH11873.1 DUF3048 domain-containing protein [Chloroflexota bacterium]